MTLRRTLAVAAVALLVGLALPAAASASTYCVNTSGSCDQSFTAGQLQTALDTADGHAGHDLVRIGPGTYSGATEFEYEPIGGPPNTIDIVGAGSAQTTLTRPAGDAQTVLKVNTSLPIDLADQSRVSDLRIQLPDGSSNTGLSLHGATTNRVAVTGPATLTSGTGVSLGGKFANSSVSLPTAGSTSGVSEEGAGAIVEGSTITANTGVRNPTDVGISATVRGSDITANVGVLSNVGGTIVAENDVVRLTGADQVGVRASSTSAFSTAVSADHLTILGDASEFSSRGVKVTSESSGTATATVTNSTIEGVFAGYERSSGSSGGTANLTMRYSNRGSLAVVDDGSPGLTLGPGNVNGGSMFVNPPANLRLSAGSPLIDAGDPAACGGTDRDGNPRVVDGNGSGGPRTDIGAYERQAAGGTCPPSPPPPPPPGADTAAPETTIDSGPKRKTRKRRVRFEFSSSEAGASFECRLDDNDFSPCTSPTRVRAKRKGRHGFEVRAIDQAGNVDSTPAVQTWRRKKKR